MPVGSSHQSKLNNLLPEIIWSNCIELKSIGERQKERTKKEKLYLHITYKVDPEMV